MNAKASKFVRFAECSSESSSTAEQQNSSYEERKLEPSVSAALKSIKKRIEPGVSAALKNIKKRKLEPSMSASAVHPVNPLKESASGRNILDPQGSVLQRWNKIFVITCVMAVSVDPLFFYIPEIDGMNKCLQLDKTLKITVSVLRTFFDLFYVLHIIFEFQTGIIAPYSRVFGRGELINDRLAIIKRYLSSYFIIDILSIIPIPQVIVFFVVPKLQQKKSVPFVAKDLLKYVVLVQYVPRLVRIHPLFKGVTRTAGILTEIAWIGAAYNLCVYMLGSHVVGAFWYLFSVETEIRCWRRNLKRHNYSDSLYLSCDNFTSDSLRIIKRTCTFTNPDDIKDSTIFNFGIFIDALRSRVVESKTAFHVKFFYCFWWGLRSVSSVGQNLKTSTYVWEILFAISIAILGLVLFAFLIGNMQKYLQSTTVRIEEMRVKRQDAQQWMSHRMLPECLKARIRKYEEYKWQKNRGVEEETLIRNLPKDLRRDIKRHLCLDLLKKVPMFEIMDEQLLDAMSDRLKTVLYTENSFIVREGDPVDEMIFIMRGKIRTVTTNGGRTGFFNSFELKAGDFCGEELLTWALDLNFSSNLPISTRTVETVSEVEAFALMHDDLKFVASQFRRLHSKQLQHTFKFYSLQWRTWGACFIQAAWRRYCKKKNERSLREAEDRLQDALANEDGQTTNLGATIFASRFAANAMRNLRQNGERRNRFPQRMLPLLPQKPSEPDFTGRQQ